MEWSPRTATPMPATTRRMLAPRLELKPRDGSCPGPRWVSTAFAKRCLLRGARCHARIREISSSKGNYCDYRPAQEGPPGYCCGCSAIHNGTGRLRPHPNPFVIVLTVRRRQRRPDLLGDTGEAHRLHSPVL